MSLHKLSPAKAAKMTTPGLHSDGGGLYLRVDPTGAKRWVFKFSWGVPKANGKRPVVEAGLGGFPAVSMARARELAGEGRELVEKRVDPRKGWKAAIARQNTFQEIGAEHIDAVKGQWRGAKTEPRARLALRYAKPFSGRAWTDVTTKEVVDTLLPIWRDKPALALKVQSHWERTFDAAKARYGAPAAWENPARWVGHLKLLLPRQNVLATKHLEALDYREMPAFIGMLRERSGVGKLALAFTILTGVRSKSTIEATWAEFDLKAGQWLIPVAKLKNAETLARARIKYFVVPLSDQALAILREARKAYAGEPSPNVPVFLGPNGRIGVNAMATLVRRMGYTDDNKITPHGFRSCVRTWGAEQFAETKDGDEVRRFSDEALEVFIGHVQGNEVTRSYSRHQYLREREMIASRWGAYVGDLTASAEGTSPH